MDIFGSATLALSNKGAICTAGGGNRFNSGFDRVSSYRMLMESRLMGELRVFGPIGRGSGFNPFQPQRSTGHSGSDKRGLRTNAGQADASVTTAGSGSRFVITAARHTATSSSALAAAGAKRASTTSVRGERGTHRVAVAVLLSAAS